TVFTNDVDAQALSPVWVEDYLSAAVAIASAVVQSAGAAGLCGQPAATVACRQEMIATFGARVFRRPLSPEEATSYQTFFDGALGGANFEVAATLTIAAMLQDPQFLYLLELGSGTGPADDDPLTSHELAARLSYFFWGSIPDDELVGLASSGQL